MEREGDGVHLAKRESRLPGVFVAHPGEVLRHKVLMRVVWDTDYVDDIRILYAYVHRLRRKLDGIGGGGIHTVRGIGYLFRPYE